MQLVFTIKRPTHVIFDLLGEATIIPLDQRLRCLLVCKAWQGALDPRALAVAELCISHRGTRNERRTLGLAEWVCRLQPRVEAVEIALGGLPVLSAGACGD